MPTGAACGLAARLGQHPRADRHDQAGLLREGNDVRRHDDPPGRVVPAQQRLERPEPPGPELHHRLVEEPELIALERVSEVGEHLQPRLRPGPHRDVEELVVRRASGLGVVHGDVGVPEQILRALVGRLPERRPDARRDEELPPQQHHRRSERPLDPASRALDIGGAGDLLEQHRELVPAEPRHQVAGTTGLPEPRGDLHQQAVARVVAQAVVHRLEVVEVEEEDREMVARIPAPAGEGLGHPLGEEQPVGEIGERIVQRHVAEVALGLFPPRDVPRDGRGADRLAAPVEDRRDRDRDLDPGAVLPDPGGLVVLDRLSPAHSCQQLGELLGPIRRDDEADRLPHRLLAVVAVEPLRRRIPVGNDAVERLTEDGVFRRFYHAPEERQLLLRLVGRLAPDHRTATSPLPTGIRGIPRARSDRGNPV